MTGTGLARTARKFDRKAALRREVAAQDVGNRVVRLGTEETSADDACAFFTEFGSSSVRPCCSRMNMFEADMEKLLGCRRR